MITVTYVPQNAVDVSNIKWRINSEPIPQGSLQEQYDQACIAGQLTVAICAFRFLPCAVELLLEIKNTTVSYQGEVRTFTEEAHEVITAAVEEIVSVASTFAKTHPTTSFILKYSQIASHPAKHHA